MSEKSKIAWTDSTLNFWEGCTKVSAGCQHCYAEARDKRFTGGKLWGKGAPRRKSKSAVKDAIKFNKLPWICTTCGAAMSEQSDDCINSINGTPGGCAGEVQRRRRIFSLSLGDWLDDEVPIEWLAEMLDTIRQCGDVDWLLCTKRPELWETRLHSARDKCFYGARPWVQSWLDGEAPANVMVLTSVENQEAADERIPALIRIPAWRRGLSMEPLLGPVDLTHIEADESLGQTYNALTGYGTWNKDKQANPIDWVIIGGESGDKARPCNVDWIRNIVAQCKSASVPVFVKQLGAQWVVQIHDDERDFKMKVLDKKGGDIAEWPADLQVREFYEGTQ